MPARHVDLPTVVREGIVVLRAIEAELTAEAAEQSEPGATLLALREVRDLANRLENTSAEEWQNGWGQWYNNQDLAVLREHAQRPLAALADRPAAVPIDGLARCTALEGLAAFLERWLAT